MTPITTCQPLISNPAELRGMLYKVAEEAKEVFEDYETVPNQATITFAEQIGQEISKRNLPMPNYVYAEKSGVLVFVWESGAGTIEFWIIPDGKCHVYPPSGPHYVEMDKLFEVLNQEYLDVRASAA